MNKDQVIKYIKENSKHPHAEMVIQYLLTGWTAQFLSQGEWYDTENPLWNPNNKYRLVKPEVKPAYRVYVKNNDENTYTYTQDRHNDGSLSTVYDNDITFITDWIEYDIPQWPTPLVARIADIDYNAAVWIRDNWEDILKGKYYGYGCRDPLSDTLGKMFSWDTTPQSHEYWSDIAKQLRER